MKEHQKSALKWLLSQHLHNRGSILADEMGLGKTMSAISLLVSLSVTADKCVESQGCTLIVCPATLIK